MVSINSILSSTWNRLLQREELYTTTQNSLSATWYLRTLAKLFVFLWQLYWEYLTLLYLWVKVAYISFIGPLSFKYELYTKMPHLISLCKSRQHAHLFLWRTWMLLTIVLAIFLSIGWFSCKTRLFRMRLWFIAWGKPLYEVQTSVHHLWNAQYWVGLFRFHHVFLFIVSGYLIQHHSPLCKTSTTI